MSGLESIQYLVQKYCKVRIIMINVVLVCTQGMSTNIMRRKIEEEAKIKNIDMSVIAVGLDDLSNHLTDTQIVVLGPQVKYATKSVRNEIDKVNTNIKMFVMNFQDYGLMRGDRVLENILTELGIK